MSRYKRDVPLLTILLLAPCISHARDRMTTGEFFILVIIGAALLAFVWFTRWIAVAVVWTAGSVYGGIQTFEKSPFIGLLLIAMGCSFTYLFFIRKENAPSEQEVDKKP